MALKLVKDKAAAKATVKDLKGQLRDLIHLLRVGHWILGINIAMKKKEEQLTCNYGKHPHFKALRGHSTSQTMSHVESELERTTQWEKKGADPNSKLSTPYLDRIDAISQQVGIEKDFYVFLM